MNSPQHTQARTATAFEPVASPAVLNIVHYEFGRCAEATRPDRVMRSPTAAILLQGRGTLFQHEAAAMSRPLPRIALLGPSTRGRVWSTEPDTRFTLVNLAPCAAQRLFGLDPRDIEDEVEPLSGHALSASMHEALTDGPAALHRNLLTALRVSRAGDDSALNRTQGMFDILCARRLGERVRDYADHFGVTMRTLQRVLRSAVGLTPKQILAVERLRGFVRLTAGGWPRSLADLAQAAGYFDQSHLRHELLRHEFGHVGDHVDGDHLIVRS